MAEARTGVYIWTTWLSKVMAGEQSCEWASWFKAHNLYDKLPSDFTAWAIKHTKRLRELHLERKKLGEQVSVEGENSFKYVTPAGVTIAGKPDLIASSDTQVRIYDIKTGQPRTSDNIQVMLYMNFVPLTVPRYRGVSPSGCVVYAGARMEIKPAAVNTEFKQNLEYFLDIIAGAEPPIKSPGPHECRFCDIPKQECPERYEE